MLLPRYGFAVTRTVQSPGVAIVQAAKGATMKQLQCLIFAIATMTVLHQVSRADEKREENPRFKGVELYSWKDNGGDWIFVLVDGTNRLKTEGEVKGSKNKVKSAQELKKALSGLAVGERVSWTHPIKGFEYPPEAMRKAIKKEAKDAKINLSVGP
jgi:hypothetical protein